MLFLVTDTHRNICIISILYLLWTSIENTMGSNFQVCQSYANIIMGRQYFFNVKVCFESRLDAVVWKLHIQLFIEEMNLKNIEQFLWVSVEHSSERLDSNILFGCPILTITVYVQSVVMSNL